MKTWVEFFGYCDECYAVFMIKCDEEILACPSCASRKIYERTEKEILETFQIVNDLEAQRNKNKKEVKVEEIGDNKKPPEGCRFIDPEVDELTIREVLAQ